MTKTEQQKRFEAAWHTKWPNDEPRIFHQDSKGQYTWPEVQDTFEGWQLCEASALERAAAEAAKCWCWKNGLKGMAPPCVRWESALSASCVICGHDRACHGCEK